MAVSVFVMADQYPFPLSGPLENCDVAPDINAFLRREDDVEAYCFHVGPDQNIDVSIKDYLV